MVLINLIMTIDDIIRELGKRNWGGTDAMTGETVINSATLEESINGDGGLCAHAGQRWPLFVVS